ncbi:unnamed protein product [Moneuplotes crassus]|uniref:Uncharacterized protein n=1 Tax=Euplotes crassus TaxID=5936 RepID=A0AAD2DAT5_EUPCR|nr:unnamed protein product [Moneuplotes crassus]
MSNLKCQHEGCCSNATRYIPENQLYLCDYDQRIQYPNLDVTHLVDPSVIEMTIKIIDHCCKDLMAFTIKQNKGRAFDKYEALSKRVKAELDYLAEQLEKALDTGDLFIFSSILHEAGEIRNRLQSDPLYLDFAIAKAWSYSAAVAQSKELRSSEVVEMELKKKYELTFEKLKIQTRKTQRSHQQEISDLDAQLEAERATSSNLRQEIEKLQDTQTRELKELSQRAQDRVSELSNFIGELQQKAQILEQTVVELKGQIAVLGSELETEQTNYQDLQQEVNLLKEGHQQEVEKLKKSSEDKVNELKGFIKGLQNNTQDLKQIINEREKEVSALKDTDQKKGSNILALNGKISEEREVFKKLQTEYDDLVEQLNQKEEEIKDTKKKLNDEQNSYRQDTQKLKDDHTQSMVQLRKAKDTEIKALSDASEAKIEDLKKTLQNRQKNDSNKIKDLQNNVKTLKNSLAQTKKENNKLAEEVKAISSDYERMEQSLISKLSISDYSDFSLLYNTKILSTNTDKNRQFGPKSELDLELNNPKHMQFLKSLTQRIPELDSFNLFKIPVKSQEVKTFLANYFPSKVKVCHFNVGSELSSSLSFYWKELEEMEKRVTDQMYIHKFELSESELVDLLSANKNKPVFGLRYCKLPLYSSPNFKGKLKGSTMDGLCLMGCFKNSYASWTKSGSQFKNLMFGLSKEQDFRKNLQWISLDDCCIEERQIKQILKATGFGHLQICKYSG